MELNVAPASSPSTHHGQEARATSTTSLGIAVFLPDVGHVDGSDMADSPCHPLAGLRTVRSFLRKT
ncbi:hypothetical protein BN874_640025 [Candidatus Contendobacter odensis Run_B_J11]|uniref:Uncharacterized protein n=1 Tax=Candidatus Contendobacter odensis Run_B_J11 TaxID=1400861 RepID=A0A7U7J5X1_9GAMM|nr:hypothetical protein BN874_640025 [Candidatus Contendobacter odensis Run_B_J11]